MAPPTLARVLSQADGHDELPDRLGALSSALLGVPYLGHSLVGGPQQPEEMVTRIDGFDCVTYVETVLALAWSRAASDFDGHLRRVRYHRGRVSWLHRNHYTHQWCDRNIAGHRMRRVLPRRWLTAPTRTLSALPDYPPVLWQVRFMPLVRCAELDGVAQTGDVVGFVSTRPDLDTFHMGLLVAGSRLGLRHASRSRQSVIEEPLRDFLGRNETPGLLVVRPTNPRRGP